MGRDFSYRYINDPNPSRIDDDGHYNYNHDSSDYSSDDSSSDTSQVDCSRHNSKIGHFCNMMFTKIDLANKIIELCNGDMDDRETREAIRVFSVVLENFDCSHVKIDYC